MKKLLFILLLTIVCIGCERVGSRVNIQEQKAENAIYGWEYLDSNIKFRTIKIDNHEYLLFSDRGKSYGKSIFILHSESCPCKKKKK